jgi:hypothetical protein
LGSRGSPEPPDAENAKSQAVGRSCSPHSLTHAQPFTPFTKSIGETIAKTARCADNIEIEIQAEWNFPSGARFLRETALTVPVDFRSNQVPGNPSQEGEK